MNAYTKPETHPRDHHYKSGLTVSTSPEAAFRAITTEVDQWWTTDATRASKLGDVLHVKFGNPYFMSMELERVDPNQELVWRVVGANMFVDGGADNNDEWVGTRIHWKISQEGQTCLIELFHEGLTPSFECYDTCKNGWDYFLASLKSYLDSGKRSPHNGR